MLSVTRLLNLALLAGASLASRDAAAQSLASWKPSSTEETFGPARPCANFARARPPKVDPMETAPAVFGNIAYCKVTGTIAPALKFELDLPNRWNGRLYMVGNGAFGGESFNFPRIARERRQALEKGFAFLFSNAGHDAESFVDASFATDRRKLIHFAYLSVHDTITAARSLATAFYGRAPHHSYFDGCSTGGRQGLIEAQRFPTDFDGILAGAPMSDYVGTMLSTVWIERGLDAARIPSSKLPLIARQVYAKCDMIDGLRDKLIADPRLCRFRGNEVPVCERGDRADCLTMEQSAALVRIYSDVVSRGKTLFPGWLPGGEATAIHPFTGKAAPGWVPAMLADDRPSWGREITENFFRHIAFPGRFPAYQLAEFDFDRDPATIQPLRRLFDARNPNLESFRAGGGKLLMYHGWADPALHPLMSTSYYESVQKRMGDRASSVIKLFMVPGMLHCAGGYGPHQFDAMTPLIQWVELGLMPTSLVASDPRAAVDIESRLICPYPSSARLKPSGQPEHASGFKCERLRK